MPQHWSIMFSFVEPPADASVHCHLYSYGLVSTHEHKYVWRMRGCREDEMSVVCRNEPGQIDEKFRLSRIDQLGLRAGLVCYCLPALAAANGALLGRAGGHDRSKASGHRLAYGRSGSTTIRTRSIAGFQRPHWSVGSQVTCSSSGRRVP